MVNKPHTAHTHNSSTLGLWMYVWNYISCAVVVDVAMDKDQEKKGALFYCFIFKGADNAFLEQQSMGLIGCLQNPVYNK